ncbi:MAG: hypothetical protein AAF399_13750 [Bacteroidota bacterium]
MNPTTTLGSSLLLFLFGLLLSANAQPSSIPDHYQLLYEQDFEEEVRLSEFEMTDPTAWTIHEVEDNQVLELAGKSQYKPRVRSPFNIAFIKERMFGDFVLEVQLAQTGREYGHRDMCLFFGMKDPSNFYYVHTASVADPHAHNVFLVNDEPRVAIAEKTTEGADWGATGDWHTMRIERNIAEGSIRVYFDDLSEPIMVAKDTHFMEGFIGFGSFDDTGRVDNIKIWGPASPPQGFGFFR